MKQSAAWVSKALGGHLCQPPTPCGKRFGSAPDGRRGALTLPKAIARQLWLFIHLDVELKPAPHMAPALPSRFCTLCILNHIINIISLEPASLQRDNFPGWFPSSAAPPFPPSYAAAWLLTCLTNLFKGLSQTVLIAPPQWPCVAFLN